MLGGKFTYPSLNWINWINLINELQATLICPEGTFVYVDAQNIDLFWIRAEDWDVSWAIGK